MVTAHDNDKDAALIEGNNELPASVTCVMSNYDLLVEILLRLPLLSILLFKFVSKHWLSILSSPDFIHRRLSQNPNLDPCSGIIHPGFYSSFSVYNFKSFDIRIPSKRSIPFTSLGPIFEILQSCNGLLLFRIYPDELYVYNPTLNQFKMILANSVAVSVRMAFDPTKSPHYKIIHCVFKYLPVASIQLQTYLSETQTWSVIEGHFCDTFLEHFSQAVYWNDAFYWISIINLLEQKSFKLDIKNDQPLFTELELPVTFDRKSPLDHKLFESRGCLLLVGMDSAHSRQLNVYEMRHCSSQWSIKYFVNLDDIMMPFPAKWMIPCCLWSIVLGEREEDSFMVIDIFSKVVQYKPILKTVDMLADVESVSSLIFMDSFQIIPSLAGV